MFLFLSFKPWRGEIVPAELGAEAVPNHEVAFVESPAFFETPFENLFVRPAFLHALAQVPMIDAEEIAARAVESSRDAEVF